MYTFTGMACGYCEQSIGAAVSSVDGVNAVRADAAIGLVTVVSAAEPNDAAIGAAVGSAGSYTLSGRISAVAH
ncbi:heavy-metal-associated domain-containing protein [Streptomyces sp. NPDC001617]